VERQGFVVYTTITLILAVPLPHFNQIFMMTFIIVIETFLNLFSTFSKSRFLKVEKGCERLSKAGLTYFLLNTVLNPFLLGHTVSDPYFVMLDYSQECTRYSVVKSKTVER